MMSSSRREAKTFKDLGLSQWVVDVCGSLEITKPTSIQRLAIPAILDGKNIVGASKTGTTAASLWAATRVFTNFTASSQTSEDL